MNNIQKTKNRAQNRQGERGNVLFYILIAVVLFAALNFVVGGMMRGGSADMIGEEQAKLYAGEILDYARSVRQAVQQIRISNGCLDTEIRFVDSLTTGYGTSVRAQCDVFDSQGGDVSYLAPKADWMDASFSALTGYQEYLFSSLVEGVGIGTTTGTSSSLDLFLFLPYIDLSICNAINEKLGTAHTSGNPPVENADAWHSSFPKFDGTYSTGANLRTIGDGQGPFGSSGCREGGGSPPANSYFFYQVLLPR